MIPLTYKENKSYKKFVICKKGFSTYDDNKKYHYKKSEIIDITLENVEELLIIFVT